MLTWFLRTPVGDDKQTINYKRPKLTVSTIFQEFCKNVRSRFGLHLSSVLSSIIESQVSISKKLIARWLLNTSFQVAL